MLLANVPMHDYMKIQIAADNVSRRHAKINGHDIFVTNCQVQERKPIHIFV